MMEELLKSGCRRPAYIGVDRRDKAAGENRYRGACHALEIQACIWRKFRIGGCVSAQVDIRQ